MSLQALSADVVKLAQPAAAARNTGGAAAQQGAASGGGGAATGVLAGDVLGPETNTVVVGIEAVPLSGAPAGGDDHKFLRFDSALNQFVYSGAVMTAPDDVNRNLVQPTADTNVGLFLARHSATQSASIFKATDENGVIFVEVAGSGHVGVGTPALSSWQIAFGSSSASLVGALVFGTTAQTADLMQWSDVNGIVGLGVDSGQNLYLSRNTSGGGGFNDRQASFVGSFTNSVHATFTSQLVINVYDFNATRAAIRIEADGSHPLTHVLGSFSVPETAQSANYSLTSGDFSVYMDTTAGNKTVTLPTAVANAGRVYAVKNTGTGANTLTLATTGGQTVDGAASASTTTPQAAIIVQSDGANWQTIAFN